MPKVLLENLVVGRNYFIHRKEEEVRKWGMFKYLGKFKSEYIFNNTLDPGPFSFDRNDSSPDIYDRMPDGTSEQKPSIIPEKKQPSTSKSDFKLPSIHPKKKLPSRTETHTASFRPKNNPPTISNNTYFRQKNDIYDYEFDFSDVKPTRPEPKKNLVLPREKKFLLLTGLELLKKDPGVLDKRACLRATTHGGLAECAKGIADPIPSGTQYTKHERELIGVVHGKYKGAIVSEILLRGDSRGPETLKALNEGFRMKFTPEEREKFIECWDQYGERLFMNGKRVDYLPLNHMNMDHTVPFSKTISPYISTTRSMEVAMAAVANVKDNPGGYVYAVKATGLDANYAGLNIYTVDNERFFRSFHQAEVMVAARIPWENVLAYAKVLSSGEFEGEFYMREDVAADSIQAAEIKRMFTLSSVARIEDSSERQG